MARIYGLNKRYQKLQHNFYRHLTFEKFIMEPGFISQYVTGTFKALTIRTDEAFFHKNKFALDYVVRLEHFFEEDILKVFKTINKTDYILTKYSQHREDLDNKQEKFNITEQKLNYRKYYDEKPLIFVKKFYSYNINLFNYTY